MLQIAHGKLFTRDVFIKNPLEYEFFINGTVSITEPISTGILTVSSGTSSCSFTVLLMESIECEESSQLLASRNVGSYHEELLAVFSTFLDCLVFESRVALDEHFARTFLGREQMVDPSLSRLGRTIESGDFEQCLKLIDMLILSPRIVYKRVVNSLMTARAAKLISRANATSAYALAVASIEALSADNSKSLSDAGLTWEDMSLPFRDRYSEIFSSFPEGSNVDDCISRLKLLILEQHYPPAVRSVTCLISRAFNEEWGKVAGFPNKKREFVALIRKAYDVRSSVLHTSKAISTNLRFYGHHRFVDILNHEVTLTFLGLLKVISLLVNHVIDESPSMPCEPYEYANECNNIIQIMVSSVG